LSADFAVHESRSWQARRELVTTVQAVIFGMMLSWIPSAALLAWFLWKEGVGIDDA